MSELVGLTVKGIILLAERYKGKKLKEQVREQYNDTVIKRMMDNLYEDLGLDHIKGVMTHTRANISPKFIADAARADKGRVERKIATNDVIDLIKDFEKIGGLEDRINQIQGYGLQLCKRHKKEA